MDDNLIIEVACLNHYGYRQVDQVISVKGISPSLKTVSGGGGEVKILVNENTKQSDVRRLTPKEYFRLMGFSDADVDLLTANGISKTQLYKMAGNSIAVTKLEYLFCQIFDSDNEIWV